MAGALVAGGSEAEVVIVGDGGEFFGAVRGSVIDDDDFVDRVVPGD
jgi:hypothetical protein